MQKLKYAGYDIVFQEVPDEVSLAINITNCLYRCEGCHSSYLSEDFGNYIDDDIEEILQKYDSLITCVCFMGGDQNIDDLIGLLKYVRSKGYKTCLYSGCRNKEDVMAAWKYLDYLKVGPYIKQFGGLDNQHTNQKFYKVIYTEQKNRSAIFINMNNRFINCNRK